MGEFNASDLGEASVDVASPEVPSALEETDPGPTVADALLASSSLGASPFWEPTGIEASSFNHLSMLEGSLVTLGPSFAEEGSPLVGGEPTGISSQSLDFILSLSDDETAIVGSGLAEPTNGVAASEPEGWTGMKDASAPGPSMGREATDAEATNIGGTERPGESGIAITRADAEDGTKFTESEIIRLTSKLVTPATGAPTLIWMRSTPFPSPADASPPESEADATGRETTGQRESERESPVVLGTPASAGETRLHWCIRVFGRAADDRSDGILGNRFPSRDFHQSPIVTWRASRATA